ncbi:MULTISPECIES: hemolysin XhlA family protein [Bacillus cereus group]|uniref:hemolysin XhlA family protein n=1 Tax=Bacillus cereus group TaxID=86661 RepID=UPI0011A0F0C0|nr:hemolysin XhlA family protein [Bacillus thuringiensis]HDR7762497.1 hemolysin XhlA family protein [Bacillus cereus]
MEELRELNNKFEQLKLDQKDIQREIRNLESRTLINEKEILTINKQLEKISANTTWILRLIVGGLLTGLLGMLMKGFM